MIETGAQAPELTLPDQDGNPVSLGDFAGKTVVLYFYPRADTSGCTTQACGVRDHLPNYAEAGAVVIGISPDPVSAIRAFSDRYALDFTLLADEDHAICDAYGTWVEKTNYGRRYWGAQRATFIIAPDGVVAHVIPRVTPRTHDDEVLAVLEQLAAA